MPYPVKKTLQKNDCFKKKKKHSEMNEAKGKRTARATLEARKRARVAPATTANSSAPAQESAGLTVASLAGSVDAPLPVSLPVLLATAPTATPLQVEAGVKDSPLGQTQSCSTRLASC
ncbi:hypothetical protein V7S43_012341 [Phytophthora oleae]|uniref:Uncharacterized protein n=1 Tax=Phytophthora oleae TaxID=2107226 RepID=A0ABD3F9V6_9STRA